MAAIPTGTVTFLFTDIEGSTQMWEKATEAMEVAQARHDDILHSTIAEHAGYVFSVAGDGFAAAFQTVREAVAGAIAVQTALEAEPWDESTPIRVRMGLHLGEVQERDADYFGPALNRTARLMATGHGGQILCSAAIADVVDIPTTDLGEHRLKDLGSPVRILQIDPDGHIEFPPLRSLEVHRGNLPIQATSLVGRDVAVKEVAELVRGHPLVTLTGVGGVGKTRLALQVGAEVIEDFPHGVWFVALAPVGDPASVPEVVAGTLGVIARPGQTVTESIADAMQGRRILLVLDNCEHLLDAAAELVRSVQAEADGVRVLATSREGLRLGAERLWPVPPLEVGDGSKSAAVALFVERAQAVSPGFDLGDEGNETAATEICRRLDGLALAIELAAARLVSMSARDVRDRLDDRFRLLSGGNRGDERHHTLQHAVEWSHDLLDHDERALLHRCAVFADGFDAAAATQVCGTEEQDEYAVLDLLDSLVRKSLVTAEPHGGHTRYGMLETIRQFAEAQMSTSAPGDDVRDRHARYFADQAVEHIDAYYSPDQRVALDWVDAEFANLRAGFRWAADRAEIATAADIAAHSTVMASSLQRYEPVRWSAEILDAATAADITRLPRVVVAAGFCVFGGDPQAALDHAHHARQLENDSRYDSLEPGQSGQLAGVAYLYTGQAERALEIYAALADQSGWAQVSGLAMTLFTLPAAGRGEEARTMADEVLATARSHGNPYWIALALDAYGRAFIDTDPPRAMAVLRDGLDYAQEHGLPFLEAINARDLAGLEAEFGDVRRGLGLFDRSLDSFHRAGDEGSVGSTLASLAVFLERSGEHQAATTVYGSCTHYGTISWVTRLPDAVDRMRSLLGEATFDELVTRGAAMQLSEAVGYAREQVRLSRERLGVG